MARRYTRRISKSVKIKLKKLSKEQSECTIYRVHRHLRDVKPNAYEPEVIAIGPYHRGKDHLKMMENHKLRNLQSLVKRPGFKANAYAIASSGVELLKARKCYADLDSSLTDSKFIDMLVLDGCFIIQLVRNFDDGKFDDGCLGEKDDPIFKMDWMITSLQRDLMLFENQVPFFVLCKLFDVIKCKDEKRTLLQHLTHFFSSLYPGKLKEHPGKLLQDGDREIKHLLDLIHRNWVPPRPQQPSPQKEDEKIQKSRHPPAPVQDRKEKEDVMGSMPSQETKGNEDLMGSMPPQERMEKEIEMIGGMPAQERKETEVMVDMSLDEIDVEMGSGVPLEEAKGKKAGGGKPLRDKRQADREVVTKESAEQERKEVTMRFINCATKLTEANVEFEMKENDTLFDIDFKDGVMVMPPLHIEDGTECVLRNLIVYEQYFQHEMSHIMVTDYMKLLDSLINSAKDVEILSRKRIITNWQGDDEVVANMVNRLSDLVACGGRNFSYETEFNNVNEHCKRPWNRWMAKLRRDYLNSPWAIISILVAVVLLLLTVTQTSLSVLQVVQEN